jgi:cytochrome c-type biogenesis protein CcmF
VIGATMELVVDGQVRGTIEPKMNIYPTSQQPVPTPDVRSTMFGDLYLNLMAFKPDGSNATIKVIYQPLVPWIWMGGGVVVLGALIGIFPAMLRSGARVRVRAAPAVAAAAVAPRTAESEA